MDDLRDFQMVQKNQKTISGSTFYEDGRRWQPT